MKKINIGIALIVALYIVNQKIGIQKPTTVCDVRLNGRIVMSKILKFTVFAWAVIMIACVFILFGKTKTEDPKRVKDYLSVLGNNSAAMIPINYQIETIEFEPEPQSFYPLTDYERWLVESIVAGESGIEPYWGKVAVASCILNACLLENKRPEEVQTMYGYAGWKPIEEFESECMAAYGNTDLSDEVRDAVSQVFDDGEVLSNEILWFYAPKYSSGSWHQTQKFVVEISNHRFYAPWN